MKAFRFEKEDGQPSLLKRVLFGAVILCIVGSFFWQMSLGFCPVP